MKRLYILAMAFIVCLGMALGATLFLSLLPHLNIIGWCMLALLSLAIACTGLLLCAWTVTRIQNMLSRRNHTLLMSRVVQFGDGGAAALDYQGQWVHLSSVHEAAKVPLPQTIVQQLPGPKKPEPWTDEATILELWQTGNTLQTICETTGMSYAQVQKVTSAAKANGAKRSKKSESEE